MKGKEAWKDLIKYRGFREQGLECERVGNRFTVYHPLCDLGTVVCVKHKTYCHSKACFEEREKFVLKGG